MKGVRHIRGIRYRLVMKLRLKRKATKACAMYNRRGKRCIVKPLKGGYGIYINP